MSKFAMLFPGQGSQSVGMLAEIANENTIIEKTFIEASEVLGYDLWALTQQGPAEKLNQTEFTQPAVLTADIALWRVWLTKGGVDPSVVAGHSLGEYAALVVAKSLSFADAVGLVAKRGRYMQEAVAVGEGAMAAIIGLDEAKVAELCEEAALAEVLSPANFNSGGQVVIAGHVGAIQRALQLAPKYGAKLAKLIPVSVPSHCGLMQPAATKLTEDIAKTDVQIPQIPVLHNADVAEHRDPESIRKILVSQLVQPVHWVGIIKEIAARGITTLIECGPGNVLAGLNKRIDRQLTTNSSQEVTLNA